MRLFTLRSFSYWCVPFSEASLKFSINRDREICTRFLALILTPFPELFASSLQFLGLILEEESCRELCLAALLTLEEGRSSFVALIKAAK